MYKTGICIDHPVRDAFRKARRGVIEFFGFQEYARKGYFGKEEQGNYLAREVDGGLTYARCDIKARMEALEDRIQAEQEEDQRFWQSMRQIREDTDLLRAQIKASKDPLQRH